jgi:hypothetical protein
LANTPARRDRYLPEQVPALGPDDRVGDHQPQDAGKDGGDHGQLDALPESVQVDAMGGGMNVAEGEVAVVVLEGADGDRHHGGQQEQDHENAEGDHARDPAQPAQQVRNGRPGRRPGGGRGARPGGPGTRQGSRGLYGLVHV